MHKFTKIAVSILLILSIMLNPFSSIFDVKAFAINPIIIEGGKYVLTKMLEGAAAGFTAYLMGETIEVSAEAINNQNIINNNSLVAMQNGVGVYLGSPADSLPDNNGSYSLTSIYAERIDNPDLTPEQVDFANYFVNYINNHPNEFQIHYNPSSAHPGTYEPVMSTEQYEKIKNVVSEAYIDYSLRKQAVETQDKAIVSMIDNGVLPQYDFSFVGPQPSISAPVINGSAPLMKDGFEYTVPTSMILLERDGRYYYYYSSEESAKAAGCDYVQKWAVDSETGTEFWIGTISKTAYGAGSYILYNGEIYYKSASGFVASGSSFNVGVSNNTIDNFSSFKSLDGTPLSSVYNGGDFKVGAVFNTTGAVQSTIPTVSVSEGEFTQQIGGGSVDVSRSDVEDIIGKAMELGLAVPDSWIQFAEDGSIQSVDGIELSKLQELIDAVKAGNLGFENMQEYLDLITKLIGAGNLTATQQKTILDNINSKSVAISEDISAIREAIESMVAEDEEVVANNDFDIDTPDSIIDKFPFCLPFDIYTVFNLLSSPPVAPQFEIPFEMEGYFEYSIDVDLSEFEMIASVVRWFLYIIFIIGLILVTNKLIGRG